MILVERPHCPKARCNRRVDRRSEASASQANAVARFARNNFDECDGVTPLVEDCAFNSARLRTSYSHGRAAGLTAAGSIRRFAAIRSAAAQRPERSQIIHSAVRHGRFVVWVRCSMNVSGSRAKPSCTNRRYSRGRVMPRRSAASVLLPPDWASARTMASFSICASSSSSTIRSGCRRTCVAALEAW